MTFKPQINKNSQKLDENFKANMFNGDQLHRWDQLFLLQNRSKLEKQMKKLEQERKDLEQDQCTFTPKLCKASYNINREHYGDISDRLHVWAKQKEQRLGRERDMHTERELDACTFKPSIKRDVSAPGDNKIKHSLSTNTLQHCPWMIKGVENHFERIELAKRKQLEKEATFNKNTARNQWKPQITIPKEFRLLTDPNSPNRSMTPSKMQQQVVWFPQQRNKSTNNLWEHEGMDRSVNLDFGQAISQLHHELHNLDL